jgi:hypothetical protein
MTDELQDFFKLLGVARDASPEEIKEAYRGLVRRHHTDINADADEEKLKEINAAHGVLSNPEKRAEYERDLRKREAAGQRRREQEHKRRARAPTEEAANLFGERIRNTQAKSSPSSPFSPPPRQRQSEPPQPSPSQPTTTAQERTAGYGDEYGLRMVGAAGMVACGIVLMVAVKAMERHDVSGGHSAGHYFSEAGLGILAVFLMGGGVFLLLRELSRWITSKSP